MTVHIWGIKNPGEYASKKLDGKKRSRYVDFKSSPNSEGSFRLRFRSYMGMYDFYPVKKRKSL